MSSIISDHCRLYNYYDIVTLVHEYLRQPYPGTLVFCVKDHDEIPIESLPTGAPNTDWLG